MTVAKYFLKNWKTKIDDETRLEVLFRFREAFLKTFELMAPVDTFKCTIICESTFSSLTVINGPQRLSMAHQKEIKNILTAVVLDLDFLNDIFCLRFSYISL